MESFEELGLAPELIEALAAEGIESPTPIQAAAIPIVRHGNNLVIEAGAGSGLLVAWVSGLLERIEAAHEGTRVLALTATDEIAGRLAESTARLAVTTEHTVAALGDTWVLPERCDLLFATPAQVLEGVRDGILSLGDVQVIVVDQAQLIEAATGLADVEAVLDYLPDGAQRVLSTLPRSTGVASLVDRLFKRAVTVPGKEGDAPDRGRVRFRMGPEPREAVALGVVAELLAEGARHALVFCRSEDRAADVGDFFTLHGFAAGAPGDDTVPVWLGVDALEAREVAKGVDGLVVVSCDAPADPDTLDRRHSIAHDGVVIVLPREVAHLRNLGKRTGYDTVPFPPPRKPTGAIENLRATIERAIEEEDTAAYMLALEPLLERYDAAEIAAATLALLRRRDAAAATSDDRPATAPRTAAANASATPAWAKLFVGVGERDGLRKGDLLGAITGEAGVAGDAVGKIEIRESHSLVEVHDTVARQVIQAINGTTIKGRSVRADYDRPRKSAPPRKGRPRS